MKAPRATDAALRHLRRHRPRFQATLVELCRIPSVSADGFSPREVGRSAAALARVLRQAGLEHVRVIDTRAAPPYVYGDWLHRPGAPTLLVYGHHDVQPPGPEQKWRSPPFQPVVRRGRLYGRGTADDKGGVMAHVAAVACYLQSVRALPCNVRFLVEGEEEVGSPHLPGFLERHGRGMAADVLVLSDTPNFATGVPALTYRLRGICQVDVEVRCLERPVHSGRGAGAVPDAVQVLCRLIAGLQREDGSLNLPGLQRSARRLEPRQRSRIRRLPFSKERFRRAVGLLAGVELAGDRRLSVYERTWTRPALTVVALEAHPLRGSANQILDAARARLSLRIVPGIEPRRAGELLRRALTRRPPHGARVTARVRGGSPAWCTEPEGPAFEAARRALRAGFGKEPVLIGAGGSIGFVRPFAEFMKGVPCLLMGIEDPPCNAHSENESLHLGDWVKCIRSAIHLYDALARADGLRAPRARS